MPENVSEIMSVLVSVIWRTASEPRLDNQGRSRRGSETPPYNPIRAGQ